MDREIMRMRKERSAQIVGPRTQKGWNEKMFALPFTRGGVKFEFKIFPDCRIQLPCFIRKDEDMVRIEFDTGAAALSPNTKGKEYFESLGYMVGKGSIKKNFKKSSLKRVLRGYIQEMIEDIDVIGAKGFKDYTR